MTLGNLMLQSNYKSQNKIQNREEVTLGDEERKSVTIRTKSTGSVLDLNNPLDNAYVNNIKDISTAKISFLKSIYGTKYIAVLGALGQPGNTVKVLDEKGINIGVYKVLDSTTGQVLKNIKKVKGNAIYDLYLFDKKV